MDLNFFKKMAIMPHYNNEHDMVLNAQGNEIKKAYTENNPAALTALISGTAHFANENRVFSY